MDFLEQMYAIDCFEQEEEEESVKRIVAYMRKHHYPHTDDRIRAAMRNCGIKEITMESYYKVRDML